MSRHSVGDDVPTLKEGRSEQLGHAHSVRQFSEIIGDCSALRRQLYLLKEYALSEQPVHIYGETGAGKELVARALHATSTRAKSKFVVQNSASMTETLIHSLLFGHRRGAFTGADRDQIGVFEAAHGGTLFLDEVGDMSAPLQAALLRVLETGEITRLGETTPRRIDVRVVSAANRPLEAEVVAGRFRADLYYRLVTFLIELPPLRERGPDIVHLAGYFLDRYNARTDKGISGFTSDAMLALTHYNWPGNIRQLRNEVERACAVSVAGDQIGIGVLSGEVRRGSRLLESVARPPISVPWKTANADLLPPGSTLPAVMQDVECRLLRGAMERANGSKTGAARILGISRQRLSQRLQRWGL